MVVSDQTTGSRVQAPTVISCCCPPICLFISFAILVCLFLYQRLLLIPL